MRLHLHVRNQHFDLLKEHLEKHKVPFVILDGDFEENIEEAIKITEGIVKKY